MKQFVHKQLMRFPHALRGLKHALRFDSSFRIEFFLGALFIGGIVFLFHPLSELETLLLILSWFLILITELQNSAFEEALDHLHPEQHVEIGKSKDMASGAVLLAAFFALLIVLWILQNHL